RFEPAAWNAEPIRLTTPISASSATLRHGPAPYPLRDGPGDPGDPGHAPGPVRLAALSAVARHRGPRRPLGVRGEERSDNQTEPLQGARLVDVLDDPELPRFDLGGRAKVAGGHDDREPRLDR